jgi:hypothetical protein
MSVVPAVTTTSLAAAVSSFGLAAITPSPSPILLRRGDQDNICGYFDGDPGERCPASLSLRLKQRIDASYSVCEQDECNCQTSGGYMGVCYPGGSCYFATTCLSYGEDDEECFGDYDCQTSSDIISW